MVVASVVFGWLGYAAWRDVLFGEVGSSLRGEEEVVIFLFECTVEREYLLHSQTALIANTFLVKVPGGVASPPNSVAIL